MRSIPFFDRLDRFRSRELQFAPACKPYAYSLDKVAVDRIVRSYTFSAELASDVLRPICPAFDERFEFPHRILWAASVLLDQVLDNGAFHKHELAAVLSWIRRLESSGVALYSSPPVCSNPMLNAFGEMLQAVFSDVRQRKPDLQEYSAWYSDALRMLDAEIFSPEMKLSSSPDEYLRLAMYNKSVLLGRVGFFAGLLGVETVSEERRSWERCCDAIGEIFWMVDDLADLEEDVDRGLWNRVLLLLHDQLGPDKLGRLLQSKERLSAAIREQGIVEESLSEVADRVAWLETQVSEDDAPMLRSLFSFWITSWLRIYTRA